jgi:hypothetical protein
VPGQALVVEVIEPEGKGMTIDAEVTRSDPTGFAVRWVGPTDALAEIARRLKP